MIFSGDRNLLHWVESGMGDLQLLDGRISKERHLVFIGKDEN